MLPRRFLKIGVSSWCVALFPRLAPRLSSRIRGLSPVSELLQDYDVICRHGPEFENMGSRFGRRVACLGLGTRLY